MKLKKDKRNSSNNNNSKFIIKNNSIKVINSKNHNYKNKLALKAKEPKKLHF